MNNEIEVGDVVKYKSRSEDKQFDIGFVLSVYEGGDIKIDVDGIIPTSDVVKVYKDKNGFGLTLKVLYNKCIDINMRPFNIFDLMEDYKDFLYRQK